MMNIRLPRLFRWFVFLSAISFVLSGCLGPSGAPVAVLSSAVVTGSAPLEVGFNLSFSTHSAGLAITFELDFGDGSDPINGIEFGIILHHTYESGGTYEATLIVIDEDGKSDADSLTITVDGEGPEIGIEVGNTAPDFTGHTTDGGEITLSDYRGEVVLLEFWGAWCRPCQDSMPHLDNLVTEYADHGLVAITISTDIVEQDAIAFLATNGYTQFVSVWEPGGKNGNFIDLLYGNVVLYPTTFVLDRQGVIRSVGHPLSLTGAMLEILL
ncbi:redoxin domain-containing protein [Candidatus Bipolaricaulota bacterium]|nr:redoxin domain-containing protein [Candidatus Bipolaricaulota bacterium]